MKTRLNLDDDVFEALKRYAEDHSIALGKAASELARRGFESSIRTRIVNGFYTVVFPPNSPKVTTEQVKRLLKDES